MSSPTIIQLPTKIETSITETMESTDIGTWTKNATNLSNKYRLNRPEQNILSHEFVRNEEDALAYLSLRTTSTYAQLYGAMQHILELLPSFKPVSILDIGSGPGTAVWAASEIWPTIRNVVCLEKNKYFCSIGKQILRKCYPQIASVQWQNIDLLVSKPELDRQFDFVTIGSVLNEMPSHEQKNILEFAHSRSAVVLLVVEPGTPYGFEVIKQASHTLQKSGSKVLAPFIENSIVVSDDEPVAFAQKVVRPEYLKRIRQEQRKINNAEGKRILPASDWEEAKYTYVATSTISPELSPWARVIAKPEIGKAHIFLKLLTKDKIKNIKIYKRDKLGYRMAKKLRWGDTLPYPLISK